MRRHPSHQISSTLLDPPRSSRYAFFNCYLSQLDVLERPPEHLTATLLPQLPIERQSDLAIWGRTLNARAHADELFAVKMLQEMGIAPELLKKPRRPQTERVVQTIIFARLSARFHREASSAPHSARSRKIPVSRTALIGMMCLSIRVDGDSDNKAYEKVANILNEGIAGGSKKGLDRSTIRREDLKFHKARKVGGRPYVLEALATLNRLVKIEANARKRFRGLRGEALFEALAKTADPVQGFLKNFVLPDEFDEVLRAAS